MRRGPIIHDSQFISLGDDAINVFGVVSRVLEVYPNGAKIKAATVDGRTLSLQPGDELIVYDPVHAAQKAHARVVDVAPGGILELDSVAGLEPGDLFFCPDVGGRGTVVRDSTFRNIDAGGIAVKAHDAVIENNTIQHVGISGIELGVYLNYYYEGPYAANTVVRGNKVEDVGFSALVTDGRWHLNGAITVGLAQISDAAMLEGNREFKGITIEDNTIRGTTGVGLFISSASGVVVRGNRISGTNRLPPPPGGGNWWGIPVSSPIYVIQSEDIRFQDNIVSEMGAAGKTAIEVHPSCDLATIDTSGVAQEE